MSSSSANYHHSASRRGGRSGGGGGGSRAGGGGVRGGGNKPCDAPPPPRYTRSPTSILRVYGDNADNLLLPAVGGGSFNSLSAVSTGRLWGG